MLAFLANQLRRSTRSLRGSATTSSRETEKFRVNPFAKVLLCTTSLLAATFVLRTSFRKPQAVTLSSLAWRNRQQPARIGRWGMVSDLAGKLYGRDARYYELIMPGTRTLQFESHRAFQSLLV